MERTLHTGFKHPGRSLVATSAAGPLHTSRLFYVQDHINVLVNTGSEVSVIPPSPSDRKHIYAKLTLTAINNTRIPTFGQRSLTLNVGLRRAFQWVFIIADVHKPIIGADILRHFGLLVDMKRRQLVDTATRIHVQGIRALDPSPSPSITPTHHDCCYLRLLSEFPELTQVCFPDTPVRQSPHYDIRATYRRPSQTSSTRTSSCCETRVRTYAPVRHYPPVI